MSSRSEQEVRRELLMKALEASSDPEEALQLARRMEQFIRFGASGPACSGSEERSAREPSVAPTLATASDGPRGHGAGKKPRWSPEEEQQLRQHWQNGRACAEMAERLGRTEVSIIARARRMGLPFVRAKKTAVGHRQQSSNGTRSGSEPTAEADIAEPGSASRTLALGIFETDLPGTSRAKTAASTMEAVITFMRSRDYSVVRTADGTFRLDGHLEFTRLELIARANRLRESLKKPTFELDSLLDAVG